jgi:hypothetical protein
MLPGMLLVLASGYLGLVLPGNAATPLLAIVFGIGAALNASCYVRRDRYSRSHKS